MTRTDEDQSPAHRKEHSHGNVLCEHVRMVLFLTACLGTLPWLFMPAGTPLRISVIASACWIMIRCIYFSRSDRGTFAITIVFVIGIILAQLLPGSQASDWITAGPFSPAVFALVLSAFLYRDLVRGWWT
jgi:hypothetical protein